MKIKTLCPVQTVDNTDKPCYDTYVIEQAILCLAQNGWKNHQLEIRKRELFSNC